MSSQYKANNFIHLRVHSSYSLASGAIMVNQLAELAARHNMPAVAVSDHGNLFGLLEFSLAAVKSGVQPIIACELKILHKQQENNLHKKAKTYDEVLLIAKNEQGYHNLLKLVSKSFLEKDALSTNHVTFEHLKSLSDGLIILLGHHKSAVGRLILDENPKEAERILSLYQQVFNDNLYLEIMRHGLQEEEIINDELIKLAQKHKLPLVATNDVYFATREMHEAHDILSCIAGGRYASQKDRPKLTAEHFFKKPREMCRLFADVPEAIDNTLKIAQRCSYLPQTREAMLPHSPTTEGRSEAEELEAQARDGLKDHLATDPYYTDFSEDDKIPYHERLEYELGIINKMGFAGYFLIVSDFIKWSKESNIPVGPGRGSGAGSIIAWTTKITDLDPLRFGLLFERFLNPERVSMPDFDIDFCQERRDEVIDYVRHKYGTDRVAQIITFGKLQAKAVLKDVGRVLQMAYRQVDDICKMIPFNPLAPVTLQQAIDMDKSLRDARRNDADVAKLLDIALKLEGLNRHSSTHAAGIVIGDCPLDEIVPLYKDPKSDMPVVQYSMKYTELAGLVKFDFLGLKTLTTISKTVDLLTQQGVEIDITKINLEDKKTFELLSKGEAVGVFQLESSGMRDCLVKMRPDKLEDIIALISLYRPGPMENIPTYIACKHGSEEVEYPHPLLEECLEETFGVIIYQEQVMQIVQILGGYSLGGADLLRRAMGKKIKSEMDAQREIFIKGALINNLTKKNASDIFDLVAKFAGYGFNKSHAAAYALIGYQTAYLKANHPVEFMTAILNNDINDTDKINSFIQEVKRMKITILPPEINKSKALFSVEIEGDKKFIRYGLAALKSVGKQAMLDLENIRIEKGDFTDVFDFAAKCGSSVANKRQCENLVKAGSFDALDGNRHKLFQAIEQIIKYAALSQKEQQSNQVSLFGGAQETVTRPKINDAKDWSNKAKLSYEFDAFGFYLTRHPLDSYKEILLKNNVTSSGNFDKISNESNVKLAGVVINSKQRSGKNGRFATMTLSDLEGVFELSLYDDDLIERSRDLMANGAKITLSAFARKDEGGIRFIVQSLNNLEEEFAGFSSKVNIFLKNHQEMETIRDLLDDDGEQNMEVFFTLYEKNCEINIATNENFRTSEKSMTKIRALENVIKVL
jgi:DNA polymerase-3 subunit alpha